MLLAFAVAMAAAGCQGEVTYQPPLALPIEFTFGLDGTVSVALSPGVTTPIGRFELNAGVTHDLTDEPPEGHTILVIRHPTPTGTVDDSFDLAGRGPFAACLDGRFYQEYSQHRVLLELLDNISRLILVEPGDRSRCPRTVAAADSPVANGDVPAEGRPAATAAGGGQPKPVQLTPAAASFQIGQTITIRFSNMPGNSTDWIGVFAPDASDTAYLQYRYTEGNAAGAATFDGLQPGSYEARAYFSNGYLRKATTRFAVGGSKATVAPTRTRFAEGEPVIVRFDRLPTSSNAWVGLYAPDAADTGYVQYQYTNSQAGGTVQFTGVPAGRYEARAFMDNNYVRIAASARFEVVPAGR